MNEFELAPKQTPFYYFLRLPSPGLAKISADQRSKLFLHPFVPFEYFVVHSLGSDS